MGVDYRPLTGVQAVPMLTIRDLKTLKIPLPATQLQQQIAASFLLMERRLLTHNELKRELVNLLNGLRERLLYGRKVEMKEE